jgi:hypothetical protein
VNQGYRLCIEPRKMYSCGQQDKLMIERLRGKPTVFMHWKAAVLDALWRVFRTPPGSDVAADKASI